MMKTEEALAMIGGHVDEELLLRNEYLAAENEILRGKLKGRIKLSNTQRIRLAKIGKNIGLKTLRDVAMIVKPDSSSTVIIKCLERLGGLLKFYHRQAT